MSFDDNLAEIAQLFIDESMEGLDIMESGLLNLNLGAADSETVNAIFRAAHSIKGGGATFGFTEVSSFAHHVETLLDEIRLGNFNVTRAAVDLLLLSVDCIRDMISSLNQGSIDTTRADELELDLTAMLNGEGEGQGEVKVQATASAAEAGSTPAVLGYHIEFRPSLGIFRTANDPLRIFRELEEMGSLEVEVLGLEALDFDGLDPEDCQLGWRLTLMANVDEEQIQEAFAWVLDECELLVEVIPDPSARQPVAEKTPSSAATKSVVTGEKPAATATKAPVKLVPGNTDNGSIRVNIDKVDELINLVGELVITQSMLSRFHGDFDFTQLEALREGLTQLSRNTRELQESVMAVRMLPISFAFNRFPRLVRDTGNKLGKNVELRMVGENTELDKTVLEKIGDPLVHLVRNSLDHGLESPEQRLAAGKPEVGILELKAFHEGGNIIIEVSDDGTGINQEKVLAKAREKGLVGADEQLSDERINNLIFMPGFSTADQVSDLSGRGVGMDVVRRNIADLGGDVSVHSRPGKGSTFTIRLPLTLAILDGQLVRVGDQSYIISLVSIVETIQTKKEMVSRLAGQSELFKLRGDYLPVLRLHEMFDIEADSADISDGLLVVAEANGERIGIFVDDLLEQQQVVIKSLEANYRQVQGLSGATILGDGKVALILDVPGLIRLFHDRANDRLQALAS